jgi:hypothetical protein
MFGRMFGRGKDEGDQPACAQCGRTLLAGEWTQKLVDDDGRERLICSLCAQEEDLAAGEPHTVTAGASTTSRDSRADSDAFWRALKDKDAQIEWLEQELARSEAEKQELVGELARLRAAAEVAPPEAAGVVAAVSAVPSPADMPAPAWAADEPAAATWGETPAELAAAVAEFEATGGGAAAAVSAVDETAAGSAEAETAAAASAEAAPSAAEVAAIASEDTQPIRAVSGDEVAEEPPAPAEAIAPAAFASADERSAPDGLPGELASPPADQQPAGETEEEPVDVEAEAASLTLLQRGVDLLNVSSVPRKIAETNEHLGLSNVHVGFDGQMVAVTFLWTMGWYRFHVDIDSNTVTLDERGYEEREDLRPNAAVRADGTVQLAPAQISRAAAQRAQTPPEPQPAPVERPAEPEPPSVAAQKPPEILSKSLLGQRSDDETDPWGQTRARDFDWDH